MIKIYAYGQVENSRIFERAMSQVHVEDAVSAIIADVIDRGDAALREYARKFDKAELENIEVVITHSDIVEELFTKKSMP